MKNIGTLVGAPVRINDSLDAYPVALQQEIKGGHHSKTSIQDMDAIGAHLRVAGMTCYVAANGSTYELSNDLLTWNIKTTPIAPGSGTPAPGSGGNSTNTTIISGNFGEWIDLPSKAVQIFDEQLAIQYKLDLSAFPSRAILYLTGQFGLASGFSGTVITLGTLPLNARPKVKIKKYMICQNIEMYLIVELNGDVKLLSKDGLNLPVAVGSTEPDPYFINVFYNPGIATVAPQTFTYNRTANFTRNNCTAGKTGSAVAFTKPYTSIISLQDATDIANSDSNFAVLAQAFANDPGNGATCTVDASANITIQEIAPNPQTGATNLFKFKVTSDVALTTDLTANFRCEYEDVQGKGAVYQSSIVLPAGEFEFTQDVWVITASPASTITGLSISTSTPAPGTTVIEYGTGNEKLINYSI